MVKSTQEGDYVSLPRVTLIPHLEIAAARPKSVCVTVVMCDSVSCVCELECVMNVGVGVEVNMSVCGCR